MSTTLASIDAQINKLISKKNLIFKKATKSQKRVMIAEDVIASIKSKLYKITPQVWVKGLDAEYAADGTQLQSLLTEDNMKDCKCCGLGACFLSSVRLFNDVLVDEIETISEMELEDIQNNLNSIFGTTNTQMIEVAFERGRGRFYVEGALSAYNRYKNDPDESITWKEAVEDYVYGCVLTIKQAQDAMAFGKRYSKSTDRLIAIMKNIIKNKGEFIP